MFTVHLLCEKGHSFEGWYDTQSDFKLAMKSKELSCPICGARKVAKKPLKDVFADYPLKHVAKLITDSMGHERVEKSQSHVNVTTGSILPLQMQKALANVLKKIRRSHRDVGTSFSRNARAMASKSKKRAPIVGTSSKYEEDKMDEEGVPYFRVPIPDIEKN